MTWRKSEGCQHDSKSSWSRNELPTSFRICWRSVEEVSSSNKCGRPLHPRLWAASLTVEAEAGRHHSETHTDLQRRVSFQHRRHSRSAGHPLPVTSSVGFLRILWDKNWWFFCRIWPRFRISNPCTYLTKYKRQRHTTNIKTSLCQIKTLTTVWFCSLWNLNISSDIILTRLFHLLPDVMVWQSSSLQRGTKTLKLWREFPRARQWCEYELLQGLSCSALLREKQWNSKRWV